MSILRKIRNNSNIAPMIPVLRLANPSLKEARLLLALRGIRLVLSHLAGERIILKLKIRAIPGLQSPNPNPNPISLLHLILNRNQTPIKDQSITLILVRRNQNKPIPLSTSSQTHIPCLFSLFPNLTLTAHVLLTVVHLVLHTPYAYNKIKWKKNPHFCPASLSPVSDIDVSL